MSEHGAAGPAPQERPLEPTVKEEPEVEDFGDARLVELLLHWRKRCAQAGTGRDPPPVGMIDPAELRFLLGWLMIMETIDGGADFRYRLYGSNIAATTGRDLTGCMVSDSFPMFAAWTTEIYRRALANRRPILTRHSPRRFVRVDQWERLILPFVDAAGKVERLLVGAVIVGKKWRGPAERLPWPLTE